VQEAEAHLKDMQLRLEKIKGKGKKAQKEICSESEEGKKQKGKDTGASSSGSSSGSKSGGSSGDS